MLEIDHISKSFGASAVLHDISFKVDAGSVTVLLGPSGCGKTTLLRLVAGLERPDAGTIRWQGQDLRQVPVHRRNFGFVFQDYALFPHKDVGQNVAFGLRTAGWDEARLRARVAEALTWVGLAGLERRAVHELSGGEQQRVALARSLAPAPALLLLDEPLGSLDRALRERLMAELRPILSQASTALAAQALAAQGGKPPAITALYVTHDQAEAFALADQVVVMNQGRVEQAGPPLSLFRRPVTPFVARFLGMENLLPARWPAAGERLALTALGPLAVAEAGLEAEPGASFTLLVRPDAGTLAGSGPNLVQLTLEESSFRGRYQLATFLAGGQRLRLEFDSDLALPAAGSHVTLSLDPARLLVLRQAGTPA